MNAEFAVRHNVQAGRFEVEEDGQLAVLEYRLVGERMVITHTGVPPALEGRGIGSRLARVALDYARLQQLKVTALCPFVAAYFQKHPEYHDLAG
ncbi:MAG: GNAT family N-acetyltransferase [Anaerolineales bacterium]